jgi:sec-independent protein translocase protein TatC
MALVPFPSPANKPAGSDSDPDWDDDDESTGADGRMSFLDHLDELRKRIIRSLIGIGIGFAVAVGFLNPLYVFVIGPMHALLKPGQQLIFTDPSEAMMIKLKIALIAGILVSLPIVMSQVWLFISPGLYTHEKKAAVPFVLFSSSLFVAGAAFAHYYVFPLTYQFIGSFADDMLTYMPRIEPTFSLWMKLVLTFGLVFQMPALVLFLAKLGLVTARFLWRNFKYAVLIISIVGAVLSPGTDPVGQIALSVPMIFLYLLSIVLAWIFGKKRDAEPVEE